MSEGDNNPPGDADFPRTTGEFRARPDISASTAQFRAFAAAQDAEADRMWPDRAARNRTALVVAAVAAAVVLIILVILVVAR
jgi:cell division protein FtsX